MLKKINIILIIITGILLISCQKHQESTYSDSSDIKDANTIKFTKQGELYFLNEYKTLKKKIDIEIAETDDKRHLGLMYRDQMQEDEGMLFIFEVEEIQSFYMKNTQISLDIIFINSKKQIVNIHKNTTPLSEKSLPSMKKAKFVLEVNAGFCDKYNIKDGDYLEWRRL
jgi:uncharacterized membrane protein (UPF0127 family)